MIVREETMREIILPEAKPAYEWVNGRALQKVSPQRSHARAQGRFNAALETWANKHAAGDVGPEWRFQVKPPGEIRRPLVPDVAFLSYDRLPYEKQLVTEVPRVAPDVAVEVLSPGDRRRDVEAKIKTYLAAGTRAIFLVDIKKQTVTVRDAGGARTVKRGGVLIHEALPGFRLCISRLFAPPPRPRKRRLTR